MDIKLSPDGAMTQIRENSHDFTEEKHWWIQLVCLLMSQSTTDFVHISWGSDFGEA